MIGRSLILWAGIVPLAVLNGVLREALLRPAFGPVRARIISGVLLSAVVFLFTLATIGWLPRSAGRTYVAVGALWVGCTIAFEVGFGRLLAGKSWADLGQAYSFKGGELWPVVLLVVGASPLFAAWARGLFLTEAAG